MEVHWGQNDGHTRIFYLNYGTSAGNSVSAGTQTDEKGSITAPEGYQLGGFLVVMGRKLIYLCGRALRLLKMHLPLLFENIMLSETFGGPHGIAFSDINSIKFGQTASSPFAQINELTQ
ncbi:LOW QUALITY PROTEIN: hypothetical protein PHMEG_0008083 [Phytophthora megakarya]|uniref:Jacalin-type lectin domain-containing protein n=1 Tax=Phytophthora megakarya TaxID=4795 RepID=A0A225WJW0_9STRA|nr:LOW QUALITY PROTEIN: hypothetical protein PHMEG_0008083 [Phytophthora megakarya]